MSETQATRYAPMKLMRRLRRLSFVKRWGVVPTIRTQTVAEHSFGVAWIANVIACNHQNRDDPMFMYQTVLLAITHDEDEAVHGDVPMTSKPRPVFSEMTQIELIVKVADYLEAYAFMLEEQAMGNHLWAHDIIEDYRERLGDALPHLDMHEEFGNPAMLMDIIEMSSVNLRYPHPTREEWT